ncbi:hypothetical protein CPT_Madawaska_269 [Staphylococcus phage Madawaska]|nr:hypothetical protein CPT_Madawaska_269 [Staphylococcus phage Madawaska]
MSSNFDYYILQSNISEARKRVKNNLEVNDYMVIRQIFFSHLDFKDHYNMYHKVNNVEDYYNDIILESIKDIIFDEKGRINEKVVFNLIKSSNSHICALIKDNKDNYKIYKKDKYVIKAIEDLLSEKDYKRILVKNTFK